ncbi:uncharacterized protein DDB_G0290685-like [Colias croceus]|uniref:uncharacterized protein DDB_G0290685-like n=1 Tax=Colias crocea TaxID=72248 RepID=UPI001E279F61|nr:uncharacterized protein DDB_G0290685-like [Colias croceus]
MCPEVWTYNSNCLSSFFFISVAAIIVACAISSVLGKNIQLNENGCPADYRIEQLYPHSNCNMFYQCFHGELVEHKCAHDLHFSVEKQECDYQSNVDCGDRHIPEPEDSGNDGGNDNGGNDNGGNGNDGNGSCNCNPGEAPSICGKDGSDGVLIAHENCNQFYKCAYGVPVVQNCPGKLLYNPYKEYCDWPENVECGDRVIPDGNDNDNDGGNDNGGNDNGGNDNGGNDNGGNDNNGNGSCNCNPGEAPSICAKDGSDGVLIAHENCNQFYKCAHGVPVVQNCPGKLLYNPYKEYCDWPENVECGDRVIPDCDGNDNDGGNDNGGNDNGGNDNGGEAPSICAKDGSDGVLIAHENCNQFYKCAYGVPVVQNCPGKLLYNPYKEYCDWPENVECGDRVIPDGNDNDNDGGNDNGGNDNGGNDNGGNDNGGNDNNGNGSCNCNPGEAPSICAKDGSDGVLIAHENCNQFYKCAHGVPVVQNCPGKLLYNPYKEYCDWPENVECGDRVIPDCDGNDNDGGNDNGGNDNGGNDNGGNDNGGNDNNGNGSCNCNPGEAPSICAKDGSDGVLIAHENCNQFYKCAHGVPVVQNCPGKLLYNPYKEYCDWPENVECGDRVIPDGNDNDNDGGNDNGGNDNGGNDNGGNDNGGNDNNDPGSCNCNPGEAPSICGKDGSDGVLVAHENCNKFYKCNHGVTVVMKCPGNTLYNPYKEYCDWPENVECGDRVIPDGNDNDNDGGNDNGGNDNGGNDNGGNDNGGNDNNDPGSCNCNPGEAPSICGKDGSDGVLVAHENCNKFYKCNHGVPVVFKCPGNTLYNPYKEYCDWPENVECGDRVIPDGNDNDNDGGNDNGGNDNGGNDNAGNDNSGSDNNGNGSCNCNPGEAPSICAKDGSDGVLIAHENCNQFYKCAHGVSVVQNCPGTLLYNPYKEYCDWPQNVQCGDRVIPDCDGNDNDGGNDNGGNDNGGDDNNDNGSCNCNPGEAPSICGKDRSDGVLVAHENCNQFYKCAHGVPVAQNCSGTLLYNPYKEYCDWPQNVECGDRVIPDCNDNGNNGGNDNGGNDNNDNGSCNCNPAEAPSICAKKDSTGVLIAHEICNQFYTCDHGVPVTQKCPGILLYNPHKTYCDWPQNVKCGDRIILH